MLPVLGQNLMQRVDPNYTSFAKPNYSDKELTAQLNDGKMRQHPNYGVLPSDVPCENCTEVLEKRDAKNRYYIDNDSDGKLFYSQQAYDQINYKDENGFWKAIDYRLKPTSTPKVYEAADQPSPIIIDMSDGSVSAVNDGYTLTMRAAQMVNGDAQTANYDEYTAGEDGVWITGVYGDNVSREVKLFREEFETSYVLNERPELHGEYLIFKEKVELPHGFRFDLAETRKNADGTFIGDIRIVDANGKIYFRIHEAFAYDNSPEIKQLELAYTLDEQGVLSILVPSSWLNSPNVQYPVLIDPIVTVVGSIPLASITGSGYTPICDFNENFGYCAFNLTVATPPNCIIPDIVANFSYAAQGTCTQQNGWIKFFLGTCGSPVGQFARWQCPGVTQGNCVGSNISVYSDVQPCILPPQCTSYNMDFQLRVYRCSQGPNSCDNTCIRPLNGFSITLTGRTVENTSITGNQTICEGNSVTLNATANYGIGPYTYAWSPGGGNGTSISVSPTNTTTYNFTVTDACNETATGTTTVNVIQNANPGFTIVPNPACVGETVTITGNGGNPVGNYDWNLPGSAQVAVNNTNPVTTTYSAVGSNSVTLNYQNGICVFPSTQTINITASNTASVNISSNPNGAICAGTSVTFTATPTNGGTAPTYQWMVNGNNVGTGGATYTSTTLTNGDVVTVEMTSNANCVSPNTATSNSITMTVNPAVVPNVNITPVPPGPICSGTSVTFGAVGSGGGSAPTYQWQVNGNNVGSGGVSYTSSTLANNDVVTVIMTSNAACASPTTATSNQVTMTVNTSTTPSVTIADNPTGPVCAGTNITFTATPTNGGTAPSYQWQLNGNNIATSATYSSSTLNNGDVVTVVMTSDDPCANPTTATSNAITVNINTSVTPSVAIAANPAGAICAGTSVQFVAQPSGGGTAPTYQWQVNGTNVNGATNANFTSTTLVDGDVVTVVITSNDPCASPTTATSNQVTMTVTSAITPSVGISANPASPICAGTAVLFTATPTNGGNNPTYQWQVNGANVGTGGATYPTSTLANGDVVTVIMTSDAGCANPTTATSNPVNMTVNPAVTPSVSIVGNPNTPVCAGTAITFNATPTNGGATPTYQWQVNGTNAGTGGSTFTSTSLSNNDAVTVIMTSNASCASPTTATSNAVNVSINPSVLPDVTIAAVPNGAICAGDQVDFTATPTNEGPNPVYQWQVNGNNVGTGGTTFSSTTLADGDIVTVDLTSDAACANPTTVTSNGVTITVSPPVTPDVVVIANPNGAICQGDAVTFTANASGGGSTPAFQWQVNGGNVGTNSNTFTSSTLADADVVTVVLTTSAGCNTQPTATSAPINMTVNPSVTPLVTISANPSTPICYGTAVTFTPNPTDGGTAPTYEWFVNGTSSGTGASFTSSTLDDNDQVTVEMTSNAPCASPVTAQSGAFIMQVDPTFNPSVTIAATPGNTICEGDQVDFTATVNDEGANPIYQWQVNGSNVGTSSLNFSSTTLNDGDVVSFTVTSTEVCANPTSASSNNITMQVNPMAVPAVTIAANPSGPVCSGVSVTFTATPTDGGNSPTYQWLVNGNTVGSNSATYTTNSLVDGDIVSLVLTSSDPCATPTQATSNQITIAGLDSISITTTGDTTLCNSQPVQLTVVATGGDGNYTYQWSVGGVSGATPTVTPTQSITYSVIVGDGCGTTPVAGTFDVLIEEPPGASFDADPTITTILEPTIEFENTTPSGTVVAWTFGDSTISTEDNPIHTYQDVGVYTVQLMVESQGGCLDSTSYDIIVNEIFAFYVPNAFTPTGDLLNDVFEPKGLMKYDYQIHVFNRWGQKVYETYESEPWNGRLYNTGEIVPQGIYYYTIEFDRREYKFKPISGVVHVIR